MAKRKDPKPDDGSPEMARFNEFIAAMWGWHHLERVKWHRPECCEVWLYGNLSTYDFNDMTRLVVLCHDLAIRAEVRRNRGLSVLLTLRNRTATCDALTEIHPHLERHVQAIRDYRNGDSTAYTKMYLEYQEVPHEKTS
jgi:hypothetical protein